MSGELESIVAGLVVLVLGAVFVVWLGGVLKRIRGERRGK